MSKFSTRLTIVGACMAVTAGLMASMTGAAAAAIPGITVNDAKKTRTLTANITTDTTIVVPNGYTLDGKGFTITAVDVASGTSFDGAVVQNGGDTMNVKNLKIEGGVPNNCVATFNGVAFMSAGGSIKNVTLNNIGQTTGCQSGRAIVVWNTDASRRGGQSRSRATPSGTTTRTGSTCAAPSTRRSSGTPSRAAGRSTTSPRTASSSTGPQPSRRSGATRSAGTTTPGGPHVCHRDPRHRRQRQHRQEEHAVRQRGRHRQRWHHRRQVQRLTTRVAGVATPTPDSPARQLMRQQRPAPAGLLCCEGWSSSDSLAPNLAAHGPAAKAGACRLPNVVTTRRARSGVADATA